MCGIIALIKKEEDGFATAPVVLDYFKQQISRGQQGFGYVSFDDKLIAHVRRQNKDAITKELEANTARSLMFHHRIPTSTPNLSDTTHPIKVSHKELMYDYYVEHNGIISNDSEMREEHLELGYKYNTTVVTETRTATERYISEEWNDSEAMAIDLVRFIEGKTGEMKSRGSIAFIALQVNKKTQKVTRVFFGRNSGNPLTYHFTDKALILRSQGETDSVEENVLLCLDMDAWEVSEHPCKIGNYPQAHRSNYGGYNGYPDKFPNTNYEDDDASYGRVIDIKPNFEEEQIITEYLGIESDKLDDKIQELLEEEQLLLADIDSYMASGDTALADDCRMQLAKNREKVNALETQQMQLDISTVTTP